MISIVLASIAGMGSAFLGNKIYPLTGGAVQEEVGIDLPEYVEPSAPPPAEDIREEEMLQQGPPSPSTEQTSL